MPSSVMATGMSVRSASSRTCAIEPDSSTPWPAKMTGRFDPLIRPAARRYSDSEARRSGR